MPVQKFELSLTGFSFPKGLSNDKANFRFVVDIRYTNQKGEFSAEHAVMPNLDTWIPPAFRRKKTSEVPSSFFRGIRPGVSSSRTNLSDLTRYDLDKPFVQVCPGGQFPGFDRG